MSQLPGLEINEPLRVKCIAKIPDLEMEMCPGGAAGGAAKSDYISRAHPVTWLDIALGKMAIECLKPVIVPDNHQIAIASEIL